MFREISQGRKQHFDKKELNGFFLQLKKRNFIIIFVLWAEFRWLTNTSKIYIYPIFANSTLCNCALLLFDNFLSTKQSKHNQRVERI